MAQEKNKLYITISDKRTGGGEGRAQTESAESDNGSMLGRYAEHQLFHLVKSTATQAVNFSINNIGNFTGDYIQQQKVNELRAQASNALNLAMSAAAGFKAGGLPGAAIGLAVGAGAIIVGNVFQDLSNRVANAKANYNIEQLRNRAGLNQTYDGSRGTEN